MTRLFKVSLGLSILVFSLGCTNSKDDEISAIAYDAYNKAAACRSTIDDLESKIDELESKIEELESRLDNHNIY